jgi:hypothetical protein
VCIVEHKYRRWRFQKIRPNETFESIQSTLHVRNRSAIARR